MSQSHKPSKSSQEWFLNRRKIREFRAREEKERKALMITAPVDTARNVVGTKSKRWEGFLQNYTDYDIPKEELSFESDDFGEATLEAEMAKPWYRK